VCSYKVHYLLTSIVYTKIMLFKTTFEI